MPEASKPAEQTARLGAAVLGAKGDMAAHWMLAASLWDVPSSWATPAILLAPLLPHTPLVRPLSTHPLYHHSPLGQGMQT